MSPAYCPTCDIIPSRFDEDGLCVECGGTVAEVSTFLAALDRADPVLSGQGVLARLTIAYYEGWPREYGQGAQVLADARKALGWTQDA